VNEYTDDELKEKLRKFSNEADSILLLFDNNESTYLIQERYAQLKDELREEARRCNLSRTYNNASDFEKHYYIPSIREASAFGLTVKKNAAANQKMASAVATCYYRLNKFYSERKRESN